MKEVYQREVYLPEVIYKKVPVLCIGIATAGAMIPCSLVGCGCVLSLYAYSAVVLYKRYEYK